MLIDRTARAVACTPAARSWLVPFETSPFPYDGDIPGKNTPFLDQRQGERRGHTSPRGGVYWEDSTYSDRRVLLSVPRTFDPGRPAVLVVYLHGNLATLERDVCRRQGVPRQVAASGLNAVVVAPQLAVDALDSSAGTFWQPNAFRRFLDEAGARLSDLSGSSGFETLPVILVAYSGGYLPAAFAAEIGGVGDRLHGLVLMDGLFGEVERFATIVGSRAGRTTFVSAYSPSSREQNEELQRLLTGRGVALGRGLPAALRRDTVAFVPAGPDVSHGEFMTKAFSADPLKSLLGRVDAFRLWTGRAR